MDQQGALEQQALEELRRGDLRGAHRTLNTLLQFRPSDAALRRRITQVEQLVRQREDAQARIQAEPLRYAHAYIQAGRLAEGLQLLRAALARDPNNARLRELALQVARRLREQVQGGSQAPTQPPAAVDPRAAEQQRAEAERRAEAGRAAALQRAEAERRAQAERQEAARRAEAQRLEAERREVQRLEAERQRRAEAERREAERREAERQQVARREAERQEAARREAEQAARREAERQEAARQEAARRQVEEAAEAARREAEDRAQAQRLEAERLAAQRAATPIFGAPRQVDDLVGDDAQRQLDEEAARFRAAASSDEKPLPPAPIRMKRLDAILSRIRARRRGASLLEN